MKKLVLSLIFVFGAFAFVVLGGCASRVTGPDVIVLDSQTYSAAFDAAVAAADADGMKPVLLDRRGGIITTAPAIAGSFLEPWKPKPSTHRQGLENTLAMQRRTARFEFVPVTREIIVTNDGLDELVGPDLLSDSGFDLTMHEGPIELRVWVYVDRKYTQGIRRDTWSLQSETISTVLPTDEPWEQVPGSFWTPITRDVAQEKILLAGVQERINTN
ncbi:MAG: hypothetical protein QF718_05015 [Phycisphaerales bacterium]|nr:hypothetical protein [Phycisphaerales bacterium]